MATNTPPMINGSDPTVLRQETRQTASTSSRVTPPSVSSVTGSATSRGSNTAPTLKPKVVGDLTIYPQAVETIVGNAVVITQSANNSAGDVVTVYQSPDKISVSAVDQTVNQYTQVDSGVSRILAGSGVTITSTGGSGTGTVTINSTTSGLGNIAVLNLDGNAINVLHGDGTWSADQTTYSNSNVSAFLAAFGSNTITTTGDISVGNITIDAMGDANISSDSNIILDSNGNSWNFDTTGYLTTPFGGQIVEQYDTGNAVGQLMLSNAANGYPNGLAGLNQGGGNNTVYLTNLGFEIYTNTYGVENYWHFDGSGNFTVGEGASAGTTTLGNLVTANYANFANDLVVQGNIANANNISATNNISSDTANVTGNLTAGNVHGGNLVKANNFSTNGSGGDITLTGGDITGSNVVSANTFLGTGNLHLQPDPANADAFLNVYLTTGPDIHIAGNNENLILGRDASANIMIGVNGNVTVQANIGTPYSWTFGSDGNLTVPSWIDGANTYFTGSIAGNVLTVTNAVDGTISWGQTLYGTSVLAETVITSQITFSSANPGGNGTYRLNKSQTVGAESMHVNSLYLDGDLKLAADHGIYVRDAHDPNLYDNLIGIAEVDATIFVGSINTNGLAIDNNKEYKVDSALNPGTYMAVAKVNAADEVVLSSGNSANTLIRVGGDSTTTGYGMKLVNGGEALIPVGLRIGDNTNSSIFGAPLEVGSILGAAANNQSSPGGIALPTYRGTDTVIANDEWGSYIYGSRYRGTINSPLPVKNGDWLMEFGATAFDGTNNNGGGEIAIRVDGVVSGTNNPSKIEFYNTLAGANTQSLGMVLDSSQKLTVTGNIFGANISTTGNISGNTNGFAIGYLNIPQVAASNTTLALSDAGKHYYSTSAGNFTLTIPNNASASFATGTAISIVVQSAGNILVNAVSGVTLYMAGNSTAANRVVSNYGMATLMKVATNTWMINGTGVA